MLLTRTPLRITLGGGGTDLPSYYETAGHGHLVAAAIDKYIYVAVQEHFEDVYLARYSQVEQVSFPHEIRHPILRESLVLTETGPGIEVTSFADIPAGTGLGSSGTFAVGLLKALYAHRRVLVSNEQIAALASHIEIDLLAEPVGKQDQYIAALGGVTSLTFLADGSVNSRSVQMDSRTRRDLEEHLVLFYTGVRRRATDELSALGESLAVSDQQVRAGLDQARESGYETMDLLEAGDLEGFGRQLTRQWRLKLERSPSPLHKEVDRMIAAGIEAGATGGKLVGAGGGGFLLFFCESKSRIREQMSVMGLREVDMRFDYIGSTSLL